MKIENQIREGTTFKSTEINVDLKIYTKAINHYYKYFNDAVELKNKIPIFLDTNILLRYYSISFKQRELLKKFFLENSDRIYITHQVQKEFIKNREGVIQKYFHTALESMSDDLNSDVLEATRQYQNKHKEVLKDFEYVDIAIKDQIDTFEKIKSDLNTDINKLKNENKQLHFKDPFLEIINNFNQDIKLNITELELLKKEFDTLTKNIDKQKLKNDLKKETNYAIPGLADILDKSENPYGDYFLFHEMIKFCLEKKVDIIFLTYDSTKGDWMKINKEPHIHYLLKTYEITEKSIFILDAERFFKEHLSTNFESLINTPIDYYSVDSSVEQDIIIEFIGLERIIRTISEFIVIDDRKSVNLLIRKLYEINIIDETHFHQLLEILKVKNDLSHQSKDFIKEKYTTVELIYIHSLIDENIYYLNDVYSRL